MKIKIATWNMAYWSHKNLLKKAWDYFLKEINADIFFFQEAKPTPIIENDKKHVVWSEIGGKRNWGSGIYSSKYKLKEKAVKTDFKGVFAAADCLINKQKLTFISLYGLLTKGWVIPNLNRILNDLSKTLKSGRIILGGDLNASLQWDAIQKNNAHRLFFERLENFGLSDCYKLTKKEYPLCTLRRNQAKILWQNDYLFVSQSLKKSLTDCKIIDNKEVRKFSDHNIVIIELEF